MKKLVFGFIFAFASLLFFSSDAFAQISSKKRPPKPEKIEETIPERLSPYHEWIEGRWKWKKKEKKYVWVEGYWRLSRNRLYGHPYYNPYYSPYIGLRSRYAFRYGYSYPYSRRYSPYYYHCY